MPTEPISYIFKPATNVGSFDVTNKNAHSRGKYIHSIEDMKNSIIAEVNSKESRKMPEKIFIARDETNIKKYGLLSENYSVNSDEADNIQEVANKRLKEKNTIKRELTMDFIGHNEARLWRVMHIEDDYLGLNNNFRIKSVSHKISGCNHTMSCSLESL